MLSDQDLDFAIRNIDRLSPVQKEQVLHLLEERKRLDGLQQCRDSFLAFVRAVWPDFIAGAHHELMAEAFEQVARGEINRLIIDMPPRFTKSQFASWLLPAWFLGKFPKKKIIQASNTEALASGFGRQVRNLVSSEGKQTSDKGVDVYHEIFPNTDLAKDSQAAGHWHTNQGGVYFAVGVNGRVTGIGGDIILIDDPHSEQEAKQAENRPEVFDDVTEWFTSGPRQRLQPGGAIIIVATRWSKRDLVGQVLRKMERDIAEKRKPGTYDHWHVINLPAILDEGEPTERSMWPAYWPLEVLQATRNSIPVAKWQAQYQQQPTSEGAAIIKREYWRKWGGDNEKCPGPAHAAAWDNLEPPACDYIIGSWDCAATKNERSHPSAYTLWGVFKAEDPDTGKEINNIILLSSFTGRMEFPELKKKAKQFYEEDRPDTLLIENKSAGMQLLQEFRSMGIPAEDFSGSSRGTRAMPNDKIARANLISDIFASRFVWAPERRFAEELIEQAASFPNGDADDLVDSTVQAMIRFRAGGFIRTANDEVEDDEPRTYRRKRMY
jgi:predicted phage terminase large subunit-like protein